MKTDEPGAPEHHDVVQLRAQLAALRHELDDLRQYLPDALVEGDLASERVTFMNRLACLVFRRSPEEVSGLHGRDLFADGEFERAQRLMREMLERGYAQGSVYKRSGRQDLREFLMRRGDGTSFPAEIQSSLIVDQAGRACGVRTLVRDITARKELEALLEEMSVRDPLTGCYNRRYLLELAERTQQGSDALGSWGCIFVDIDRFKQFNDEFGHQRGDEILQRMARFIMRHVRADEPVIRLGGDEFLVALVGSDEARTADVARRLQHAAARSAPVAFSLGWAVRRPSESLEATLLRANRQLIEVRVLSRGGAQPALPPEMERRKGARDT